jgi:large subunit ribosomal protein L11
MKITSRIILAEDKAKKGFQRVTLKLMLPVGEAKNNPILGPLLGQHQINIMSFCNEFNAKSVLKYQQGVMVPVFVNLKKDKTYELDIRYPNISFFIDQFLEIKGNVKSIPLEKIYDIIKILSFFLKKDVKSISIMVFGYLSSYINKIKIK